MREQTSPTASVTAACGSWHSPICLDQLIHNVVRLGEPAVDGDRVCWLETRPSDGGRSILVAKDPGKPKYDLTPEPFSVRSRAHEYGGGSYLMRGERLWFINDGDQCIYFMSLHSGKVRRLTEPGKKRYAQLCLDEAWNRLIAICEDHSGDGEPASYVAAIDLDSGRVGPMIDGADFYSDPQLSPNGRQLAWLSWSHPNLPWDTTELWLADLDADGNPAAPRLISLGRDESVFCPLWSPDGTLYFVSDRSGWWNLYRQQGEQTVAVNAEQAECGMPQWVFGMCTYGFIDEHNLVVASTADGLWRLHRLDLRTGEKTRVARRWTNIGHVAAGPGHCLLLGGSEDTAFSAISVDDDGNEQILGSAMSDPIDPAYVSIPKAITFPTSDGDVAHGFYYAPVNPAFCVADDEKPPLLVNCHGGPTSATVTTIKLDIQFWTTRGFAVLDVNYRGSTGYGREYRQKLYGAWGLADIEDCIHGARYLTEQGLADPKRLGIRGGSAGGFAVLAALAFHDTFAVGASFFGIGDLKKMFETTHKFEACYDYWLLGPKEDIDRLCEDRSPLHHADRISCPTIFLQGLDDKVVPPEQSASMARALERNGIPVTLIEFAGEGHGFRQSQNIRRGYEAELYFYGRILGFTPADDLEPVVIRNLEDRA